MSLIGIAGDPTAQKLDAIRMASSLVGIAGTNTNQIIASARTATRQLADDVGEGVADGHANLGDRTQREGWRRGCYFADYTYLVSPFAAEGAGRRSPGGMYWRKGREAVFNRAGRGIPLLLDSTGFRRVLTRTAPAWADAYERYPEAIRLIDPDGFAAWDDPTDRAASLAYLDRIRDDFPGDDRLWPVWSVRWSWDPRPPYRLADLPRWASTRLVDLIPRTPTHAPQFPADLEDQARLAVLNAVLVARDPDFQAMAARHGKVMLGGLVQGPVHRFVRHLFVKALYALVPAHYWLLGQASAYVVNGLAYTGMIDHVSLDGSWWVQDALCHKVAFVQDGLINVSSLGGPGRESFFTTRERMAALLRSLLSMYAGLVTWPTAPELPVDFRDLAQLDQLQTAYRAAQLDLGLS